MLPGLLAVTILVMVLFTVGFIFLYSFYLNTNNKLYKKMKLNYSAWGMVGLLNVIFLLTSILILISFVGDSASLVRQNFYLIPMTWILFLYSVLLLVLLIIIQKKINKTRLDITKFRDEDFKSKLDILEKQRDAEYEARAEKKHQRYFSIIKQKEDIIYLMFTNFSKDNYQNLLTEIIMFNESSATRWSKKMNAIQLRKFYEMCVKLQSLV